MRDLEARIGALEAAHPPVVADGVVAIDPWMQELIDDCAAHGIDLTADPDPAPELDAIMARLVDTTAM